MGSEFEYRSGLGSLAATKPGRIGEGLAFATPYERGRQSSRLVESDDRGASRSPPTGAIIGAIAGHPAHTRIYRRKRGNLMAYPRSGAAAVTFPAKRRHNPTVARSEDSCRSGRLPLIIPLYSESYIRIAHSTCHLVACGQSQPA